MPPKVFGWQHLVYLAIFIAVSAGAIVAIKLKVKSEKTLDIIIKSLGGALLVLLVWNRIAICIHKNNWLMLLPDSFCGVSSLCMGICAIFCKRDALPFHYLVYIAVFGGAANDLFPYYLGQADYFMYPATISGMLHHSLSLDIGLIMLLTGYFKPCLKKLYAFPLGVCFTMVFGIFLVDALKFETAMYIYSPLVGPLTWYMVFPAVTAALYGALFLYEKVILPKITAKKQTGASD
ncbi:MAG: hypothetical protein HDP34_03410 [Clostridia bacterium]|nr:hypothetical protein [Clostridia bacterium]